MTKVVCQRKQSRNLSPFGLEKVNLVLLSLVELLLGVSTLCLESSLQFRHSLRSSIMVTWKQYIPKRFD